VAHGISHLVLVLGARAAVAGVVALPRGVVARVALLALVGSGADVRALLVVVLAGLAAVALRVALLGVFREATGHSIVVAEDGIGRVLASRAREAHRRVG
jgi:hypothetical protein